MAEQDIDDLIATPDGDTSWGADMRGAMETLKVRGIDGHTFNLREWSDTPTAATINTAITDLETDGGGNLLLPRGTIALGTTTVNLHSPRVSLIGAGEGATILTYAGTGAAISYGDPTATVTPATMRNRIADLTVESAGAGAGSIGLHVIQCLFPVLERVAAYNLESGIVVDGGASWVASGTIFHPRTVGCTAHGIHYTADAGKQTNDMRLLGGYVYGGAGDPLTSGIGIRVSASCDTNVFFGPSVEEYSVGYQLDAPTGGAGQRFFSPRLESCTVGWKRADFSMGNVVVGASITPNVEEITEWENSDAGRNTVIDQARTFPLVTTLPFPDVNYRGMILMVEGGAGTTDRLVVCQKAADDSYAWRDLW